MGKKLHGFTLVELLVVLSVIGILAGMIFPALKRGISKANDEKCRTNLKQLHTACINYANEHNGKLPFAQSYERKGLAPPHEQFCGWVAWSPADCNPSTLASYQGSHTEKSSSLYHDRGWGPYAKFGVENGQIFEYMNESMQHYVCPAAEKISIEENNVTEKIYRTYAMNEFFYGEAYSSWWTKNQFRWLNRIGTDAEIFKYSDAEKEEWKFVPEASKLLLFTDILIPNYKADKGIFRASRKKNNACRHGDCVLVAWEKANIDTKTTDVIMPIHQRRKEKSLDDDKSEINFGYSFAIFLDGHIEHVQQSFKIGNTLYNTLWFLNRGIDPKNTKELGDGI